MIHACMHVISVIYLVTQIYSIAIRFGETLFQMRYLRTATQHTYQAGGDNFGLPSPVASTVRYSISIDRWHTYYAFLS
jgi:hypothetical protein